MSQHDMFEHDELDPSVLEHITELPEGSAIWPATLLELYGVINRVLDDSESSMKVVLNIGEYMGGMQVYLPRGDKLQQQIRDMTIYNEFNGRNHNQLAKKHHVTAKTIYEVIARMKRVEIQRRQFDLF